jgi:hypothetical protein
VKKPTWKEATAFSCCNTPLNHSCCFCSTGRYFHPKYHYIESSASYLLTPNSTALPRLPKEVFPKPTAHLVNNFSSKDDLIEVEHNSVEFSSFLLCCFLTNVCIYCTVMCCTVQYYTAVHCTVLYCTVLYCAALCCTVLYCTARTPSYSIIV